MPPPPSYIDLTTFPHSQTITQTEFNTGVYGGTIRQVWLRFVTASTQYLGSWVEGVGNLFYDITYYASDGSTVLRTGGLAAMWWRLPAGTYYVKITNGGGSVNTDFDIYFDVSADLTTIPVGSLVGTDDKTENPGVSTVGLSATIWQADGTFLGFKYGVPAGEIGDSLPNGISLWHDRYGMHGTPLALLDANLDLVAAIDTTPALPTGALDFPNIANDGVDFYVLDRSTGKVHRVTDAGTVTQIATLPSPTYPYSAIGVTRGGSTLYWTEEKAAQIHAHDLAADTPLADVYTVPGFAAGGNDRLGKTGLNDHPGEIIVQSDGSLVLVWYDASAFTFHVLHVSAGGTLLHDQTYVGATGAEQHVNHLHFAPDDDPGQVTIWIFQESSPSGRHDGIYGVLDLASGTLSPTWTINHFTNGRNMNQVTTAYATPHLVFGPSFSCTLVRHVYTLAPTTPGTGLPPTVDNTPPCPCPSPPGSPADTPDDLVPFVPLPCCTPGGTVEQLADLPGIGGCWL